MLRKLCEYPLSLSGAAAADAYAEDHRHDDDPRPCGRLCAHWHRRRQPHQMAQGVDKLAQAPAHDLLPRGGASMSMKDAIFGTAAPTSHGGATYRDSIQAWLPVKNIIGGVVITKDNRFIKILEVLPVNFCLKSPSDQQNIITSYAAYLKIAPDSMSCEVRTLPPDTSEYVEQMRQFQKTEESENCRAEIEDNIEKIGLGIASESIRHRFFLVFQYEAKMRAKRNTVKGIIQRLNEEADTARRYLDICELEVLEPRYTDDFVLKLLYELINKGTSLRVKLPEGVFDMTTEVHGVYGE